MEPELVLLGSVAAGSLVLLVYLMLRPEADPVAQRVAQIGDLSGIPRTAVPVDVSIPRLGTSRTVRDLDQNASRTKLRERIVQAGLYKPNVVNTFIAMRMALCIAPVVIGFMLSSSGVISRSQGIMLGAIAGLAGTLAPTFWLDHRKRQRQLQIRRALPDALDVIIICLEAGVSISSALARVARELKDAHPLLAVELAIVEREVQMGRSTGHAVREFGQRFDLEELRSLAAVISQAEQFGTSVAKAFGVYAETMRVRRHQLAEEMAQKAGVKILFPTLLCIFPGIFIVVLGPAVINIYRVIVMGIKNGTL